MLNAMQATDMGMSAFSAGYQSLIDCIRQYRENQELIESLQYEQQLQAWKNYAKKLQNHNLENNKNSSNLINTCEKIISDNETLAKENEKLRIYLAYSRRISNEYSTSVTEKLPKVNEFIKRLSGKSYAYEKMSERLLEEIRCISKSENTDLIDPEKFKKQLEEYWDNFMENNEVRKIGYPEMINIKRPMNLPDVSL